MSSNQLEATMTHDSDMELVTRTLQGDAVAFGTLVERYQQAVHAVCVSLVHDFDLAQDLTQEAFLKALQHLHHLAIPARFGNWLRIIAMAVKMRLHRARQHIQKEAIAMVEHALTQHQLGPEFAKRLQLADITVLFADIAGIMEIFTQYPPEEALTLLYACMGDMTQSLVGTGGALEGYQGDALVAFWGAPVPTADHAVQGCLAALAIQDQVVALDAKHHQPGKPHLQVTCGLQTGQLFVGELSPRRPLAYTFLGMAAGIASTLKSANHRFGTAMLAGRETYEPAQETSEARLVGPLKTRLHHEPIMAYAVLAHQGALESFKMQASARYLEGLAHYQARR
jgi:class 3 adenylate cyclase